MAATALTATVTTTTTLKLTPQAKAMLKTRAEEFTRLAKVIKDAKARQGRIKDESEEIFNKEKQGKALLDGCEVEGHKFKMVVGSRKVLDKLLLVELGCDPEWLEAATIEEPNQPYLKITAPGGGKDE